MIADAADHNSHPSLEKKMHTDTLEAVQLGNITQWIRTRGTDPTNPVLLLIQQGPGLPMINEVRRFERALGLEEDFTVVYWDQRGCGRSLRAPTPGPRSPWISWWATRCRSSKS